MSVPSSFSDGEGPINPAEDMPTSSRDGSGRFRSVAEAIGSLIIQSGLDEATTSGQPPTDQPAPTAREAAVNDPAANPVLPVLVDTPGNASIVPPFESFAGRLINERRLRDRTEERLCVGDRLIGRVRTCDAAGARVKLICGAEGGRRMDLRETDMQVLVPVTALGKRPQVSELLRIIVEAVEPLRYSIDEAMESVAGPPILPEYLVDERSYSEWTEDLELVRNRHAEEAVGLAGRATGSMLQDVLVAERGIVARRKQNQREARRLVTQGIAQMRAGDKGEAWDLLKKASETWVECADAYVALGALLVNDGRLADSEKYFERALGFEPEHRNARKYFIQTLFGLAKNHEESRRWADALGCYERAIHHGFNVADARAGAEHCREELNKRANRSPSVEEVPATRPKRMRISDGAKSSSESVQASSGIRGMMVAQEHSGPAPSTQSAPLPNHRKSATGHLLAPGPPAAPLPAPGPPAAPLAAADRKRLSDLADLHAMLKNEAGPSQPPTRKSGGPPPRK